MGVMAVNASHPPSDHPVMHVGSLTALLVTFTTDLGFIALQECFVR